MAWSEFWARRKWSGTAPYGVWVAMYVVAVACLGVGVVTGNWTAGGPLAVLVIWAANRRRP